MEEHLGEKEACNFLLMVRSVFQDERKFRELLCILKDYPSKRIDFEDFITLVTKKLLGHKDLILEFRNFLPRQIKLKWENITPSYWKFPESQNVNSRTKADVSVLNDDLVVIAPKENRYFTIRDKDPVEEAELKSEDERYKIDTVIEWFKTTIVQVEMLLKCLQDAPPSEVDHGDFYIENFLTAPSLKFIIMLYDYCGLEVINNIRMDAKKTLPIILARLIVKRDVCIAYKSNFEEIRRKRRKPNSKF